MRGGRRARVALAAGVLALLALGGPAEGAGEDCGTGADTPPAIHLASGQTCNGTMQGETYSWSAGCSWFCVQDHYTFTATLDDAVTVTWNAPCVRWSVDDPGVSGGRTASHTFVASKTSSTLYNLHPYSLAGFDGGGCPSSQLHYTVNVRVVANTRPTLSVGTQPTTALPADPVAFTFSATDPENNLFRLGVKRNSPSAVTNWVTPNASGSGTLTHAFISNSAIEFLAEDVHGARATPETRSITLVQDDCGTGADVSTHTLALGSTCAAHLARSMTDDLDVYEVAVPAGTPRLLVSYARTSGELVTDLVLRSPSGVPHSVTNGSRVVAEPGIWKLEVARVATGSTLATDLSVGGYVAGVSAFPAAAPPVLTASAARTTLRYLERAQLSFTATEPNGLGVYYEVDWGDGATTRVPATGFVASGTPGTASHGFYPEDPPSPVVTVTATSEDGLTATQTITLTVVKSVDRCAGLGTAVDDAPGPGSWSTEQTAAYQGSPPMHCDGELGYFQPAGAGVWATDGTDTYRFFLCATGDCAPPLPSRYRVTVTTAEVELRALLKLGTTLRSATVPPGSSAVLELPAVGGLRYELELNRVLSSTGTYSIDIELIPGVV